MKTKWIATMEQKEGAGDRVIESTLDRGMTGTREALASVLDGAGANDSDIVTIILVRRS